MINIDQYLIEFVKYNSFTLTALGGVLIGLAKISPWKWDEKVLDVIIAPFKTLLDSLASKSDE
jgi:hypothetical protein